MHYIYSFILFIFLIANAQAITLSVTSSLVFDLTDKAPTEAGKYLKRSYKNDKDGTLINVSDIESEQRWAVYVRQLILIDGLKIKIKRTGNGTGTEVVEYGKKFLSLKTDKWKCFFTGQGQHSNIPVQTKVSRIGISDSYGEYNTNLSYKVETYNGENPCK